MCCRSVHARQLQIDPPELGSGVLAHVSSMGAASLHAACVSGAQLVLRGAS